MSRAKPPFPVLQRDHGLAQGLVGAWAFYEGSGDRLYDLSGNGHDGTLGNNSLAWSPGQWGWALDFPGSSFSAIDVGNVSSTIFAGDFSIFAWVLPDTIAAGNSFVFDKRAAANDGFIMFRAGANLDNRFDGTGVAAVTGAFSAAGVWTHVGYTRQGNNVTAYVDGVDRATASTASDASNTQPAQIGTRAFTSPTSTWDGLMSDMLLYDRALSPAEVAQLYHDPFALYRRRRVWMSAAAPPAGRGGIIGGGFFGPGLAA